MQLLLCWAWRTSPINSSAISSAIILAIHESQIAIFENETSSPSYMSLSNSERSESHLNHPHFGTKSLPNAHSPRLPQCLRELECGRLSVLLEARF